MRSHIHAAEELAPAHWACVVGILGEAPEESSCDDTGVLEQAQRGNNFQS